MPRAVPRALLVLAMVLSILFVGGPASRSVVADPVDGGFDGTGRLVAGATLELAVLGRGGVPSDGVEAVALNVTATRPSATAFVTVWPSGEARPLASNLNVVRGRTVANMVLVRVGAGGTVSLFTNAGATDMVVDVLGYVPTGGGFTGLGPARLIDTRGDGITIDGAFAGTGALQAGATFDLTVAGRGGVPAAGVGSVALNVTVTNPTAPAFVTVWPTGSARPLASNLNVVAGRTAANMVLVPLGAGGQVSLFVNAGTADVIVDVLGWFPSGSGFEGSVPTRLVDTRVDGLTVDGGLAGVGAVGGAALEVRVLGRGGVPATGVGAVALNVTVTNPTAVAFVTVWPTGSARPLASNLNVMCASTVPNMVLVPVRDGGRVSVFVNAGSADVIVDVLGWFPVSGPTVGAFVGLTPARLMDTRSGSGYLPLELPSAPQSMAFDGSRLWMADRVYGLTRVDIGAEVAERVPLPGFEFASDLLFDGEYLWITGIEQVGRFDPAAGTLTTFGPTRGASGPNTPVRLGADVWTINRGSNSLSRIDRLTGATRVYPLPDPVAGASGLATDGRFLWFPSFPANAFVRFDPATRAIAVFALSPDLQGPLFTAFDGERVWTARQVFDGSVPMVALTWVAVVSGEVGNVELPVELGHVTDLEFDGTAVWASTAEGGRLARVAPDTGVVTLHPVVQEPVEPVAPFAHRLTALAFDGSRIWAASLGGLSFVPAGD